MCHALQVLQQVDSIWTFVIDWEGKDAVLAYLMLCEENNWIPSPPHFKSIYLGKSHDWCSYIEVNNSKYRFKKP